MLSSILNTSNRTSTAIERLSSGKRVNSARDDAAGLAIATKMGAEAVSISAAGRNTLDGISVTQTADGALKGIGEALGRMRELAVQANNGTLSQSDRDAINQEFSLLNANIGNTVSQTQFNGQNLLDGSYNVSMQTGPNAGNTTNITIGDVSPNALGISGLDTTSAANASNAISAIDQALGQISTQRSNMGAMQSAFESTGQNLSVSYENTMAAKSRIMDADFASETSNLSRDQVLTQANLKAIKMYQANDAMKLSLLK